MFGDRVSASSFASGLAYVYRRGNPFQSSLVRFSVLPAGPVGLGIAGVILGPSLSRKYPVAGHSRA
jgi:hypothetical protein